MNILLTNDDGYLSTGIRLLKNKLSKYGKVVVVAPKNVMSAKSTSITLGVANEVIQVEPDVFAFDGTPADCVAFGLDKKAKEDIMNKNVWPVEARMTIIEFLENYKTAYSLKRLDYIRTIFDDDAVIIVGHVAKVAVRGNDNRHRTYRNKVTLTQYEKEQYIKHLEVCFRSNEFINIRFVDNDVRKAKEGEEYGIQIKQDYYSTNYGDEGYLYIQVDLNERQEPIIRVRTWQPQPDPEIGLFGLGNW